MNSKILQVFLWVGVSIWLAMTVNNLFFANKLDILPLSYSQFLREINDGAIQEVTIQDQTVLGVRTDGSRFETYDPG